MVSLITLYEEEKRKRIKDNELKHNIFSDESELVVKNELLTFKNFIGQQDAKSMLTVAVESAKKQEINLDHILLHGFPGLGKSKLARIVANEMEAHFFQCVGSELQDKASFEYLIKFLRMDFSRKVVFIDEIHSLSIKRSEILYEAVQDFKLKGIDIPKFCLIGATTYAGTIDKPLRNRFHYLIKLNYYSFEEIKDIIKINYPQFSDDVAMYIAIRSKGIPRIALSYSRIANSVSIYDNKEPSKIHVDFTMDMLNINEDGYTFDDIEVIKLLYTEGRPIGRQSICSVLGIDTTDYISNIEPVLMKSKLLIVTPRGRRITDYGIAYLRNRRYIS